MTSDERWLWNLVTRAYARSEVLAEVDTAALKAACELWGLYRAALKVAQESPIDKLARTAVLGYWAAFERVGARLGLTPCDRARLLRAAETPERDTDPMADLFRQIAAKHGAS